jgi:hypothetical protein
MFPGPDDRVIVCEELWATKVYQTSNLSEAPQPGAGSEEGFQVALTFVPAVFTQDVEDVKVTAVQHSSLAGWANELDDSTKPKNSKMAVA